jgi:hypothetical protein
MRIDEPMLRVNHYRQTVVIRKSRENTRSRSPSHQLRRRSRSHDARAGAATAFVQEVDRQSVDDGTKVSVAVDARLMCSPVIPVQPVLNELPEVPAARPV